ncbi:hypothetical protein [Emticicia oligotrophica]|uniref:hypothetical protein n=1 Tax=Emticicia oligotrophica TaxID=312279 RepID=UPI00273B46FE|nr:hypothetical protein [Emticicia oligotrophica]
MKTKFILLAIGILYYQSGMAQKEKFYFTTSVGVIKGLSNFATVTKPSIGFNSAIEMNLKRHFYLQGTLDFNSLKYNQKQVDATSEYIFQDTNSSLLLIGMNVGKNITFSDSPFFTSFYIGTGFLNNSEPRVVRQINHIVSQKNISHKSIFGRGGLRMGYQTKSKILQTLYMDTSYWTSPTQVQGGNIQGISFFIGTRYGI